VTRPNVIKYHSRKNAPFQLRHTGSRFAIEEHLVCNYWCWILFVISRQLCQNSKQVVYIFLVRVDKLTIDHGIKKKLKVLIVKF